MGSERPGNGFCADGFCSEPGPGSSSWVVISRSICLAFPILDDSRIRCCCRCCYFPLRETHKRTFKNQIRSTQPVSSPCKNHFEIRISSCIHGHYSIVYRKSYAYTLYAHFQQ